jgi:peptide/nickel transport system substrate-binding protein
MPRYARSGIPALALVALILPLVVACGQAPSAPPAAGQPTAAAPKPTTAPAAAPTTSPAKPTAAAGEAKRGGTLRVGLWQEPTILNPLLGTQTVTTVVSQNILEGLLQPQPDGTYAPQLAAEVPSQQNGGVSEDGLTITWTLKPGVTWSDGRPFTSRDVVFTYNVYMNAANPIVDRTGYPEIESVTAPDDTTVVVKYKALYAAFKAHFLNVLPEHAFGGDTSIDNKDYNRAPLGTGPFVFKTWASGDTITMERNPNYREQDKPYLDGIIWKITPSREAAIQAFKVGEIDAMWNLIEVNIPEFQGLQDTVLETQPSDSVERLILNASCPSGPQQGDPACPHPVLSDQRVREAIELAIDKKSIVDKLLFGRTTVATSVIPLGWYAPTGLQPSEYNPDKAKQLLQDAGWTPGPDGVRTKDGVRATLEYSTTTGDRLREQTQQVIQEMLAEVGIQLDIKNSPSAVLLGGWVDNAPRARGNFDIAMWTTNAGLDPQAHLANYFHSNQLPTEQTRGGRNYHRVPDQEIDAALAEAGSTVDEPARKTAYQRVAERVNALKVHIVLYNRLEIDAFKSTVKGYTRNTWDDMAWDTANWWLDR